MSSQSWWLGQYKIEIVFVLLVTFIRTLVLLGIAQNGLKVMEIIF